MEKEAILDYALVPMGLMVMVAYHVWLFHRITHHPKTTIFGINAINRRFWVSAMMEDAGKSGVLAVQTLRNNIMASTLLASTAITLSSIIAVLMTGGDWTRSAGLPLVLGDRSELGFSIKFFSILVCFLVGFFLNVQSIRYYSHASFLITIPFKNLGSHRRREENQHHCLTTEYVAGIVNRGSCYWSVGLRAFYFSFPLFFWMFGPIPMFLCCLVLLCMLYFLDVAVQFGWPPVTDSGNPHIEEDQGDSCIVSMA
ncbi:uncharacterized protein LOC131168638 [Malania oleifera]|uniref:uncharacterized protein LOC131168638 n=1 Tax=Malania oleifera TaxID=397392 RepID=UPI0025AE80F8|nr:uncharacterized protein LOC131168638 [Malania oleifera]